jgi:hypothetical protein
VARAEPRLLIVIHIIGIAVVIAVVIAAVIAAAVELFFAQWQWIRRQHTDLIINNINK